MSELQEAIDLRAEGEELWQLLSELSREDWSRPTPFKQWTPFDVVLHLHQSDRAAVYSLTDAEGFIANRGRGLPPAEFHRDDPLRLQTAWREYFLHMCSLLGASDGSRRVPWFGPDMGVRMFTTARQMETWAHAHDVYDLLGRQRTYHDRLRNIVVIGVRTYGWTFANRKREVPGPIPFVKLTAPSSAIWAFNDESTDNYIEGKAVDFCHVVTQGRNIADTPLRVVGHAAKEWMAVAQCFAGPPVDPPKPGERLARG